MAKKNLCSKMGQNAYQISLNGEIGHRPFYAYIFSEKLFGENICLIIGLLGSFLATNLKKPQSRKLSTCQSKIKYTLRKACTDRYV